jgi:hypothetical protein
MRRSTMLGIIFSDLCGIGCGKMIDVHHLDLDRPETGHALSMSGLESGLAVCEFDSQLFAEFVPALLHSKIYYYEATIQG